MPLPSASATNAAFMAGTAIRPFTTAYPMRWVKLTFPPTVRNSWLFTMVRLTSSSLAGTTRTLVAVGTPSDASMLATILPGRAPEGLGRLEDRGRPRPRRPGPEQSAGGWSRADGDGE